MSGYKYYMVAGVVITALTACSEGGEGTPLVENNNPPTISGSPTTTLRVGDSYQFLPMGSDPDGDALTYSVRNLPLWLNLDPNTGSITGQPQLTELGLFEDIQMSVSDGVFFVELDTFDINVVNPSLSEDDISPQGFLTTIDTGNPDTTGYMNEGLLEVFVGDTNQRFENSTLELEFDANGNLLNLQGESDVPKNIFENITFANNTRARVGLMTGTQINEDPSFGITLKDEFDYFVFYIGTSTQITIGDPNDPGITESVTLDLPASGEIIFISDPFDPFTYRFAAVPFLGEYGFGESAKGFIPFIPQEGFDELDSFDGDTIEKTKFSIGFKAFDFFEIEGNRVTRVPDLFSDIDWENPLDSSLQFKAGINGNASFAFSIFSVGLFDFSLASASATFDVGSDRQHSAMQMTIAPDVSWQPAWFPILPATEVVGRFTIDGSGDFSAKLSGSYESTIPEAQLSGLMELDNDSATFSAEIPDDIFPLSLSMVFENNGATAIIRTPDIDINPVIKEAVLDSFDRTAARARQAQNDADEAFGNYQIAFSLNGLRREIPVIADQAIARLNAIPGTAQEATEKAVIDTFRSQCVNLLVTRSCASDFVNEVARGQSAGRTARNRANIEIEPYVNRLNTLKARANEIQDGPAFRSELKSILLEAIANSQLSFRYSFSQTVDLGVTEVVVGHTHRQNVTVLTDENVTTFQTAADNVDNIEPTFSIMLDTRAIFDSLPTDDEIAEARQNVENNLTPLPVYGGAGYTTSGFSLSTFIVLDGENFTISDINPLDPASLLTAASKVIEGLIL